MQFILPGAVYFESVWMMVISEHARSKLSLLGSYALTNFGRFFLTVYSQCIECNFTSAGRSTFLVIFVANLWSGVCALIFGI